jgi:hypothetical protein
MAWCLVKHGTTLITVYSEDQMKSVNAKFEQLNFPGGKAAGA